MIIPKPTCIMTQILTKLREVDPNNSEAVKDALATFYQNLPKHTEVDCYRWSRALGDVINRFPKYCMSHRATIETHLAHFLASSNYHNVIEAAKCAHALQQVRPSQEKTATPKSSWRDQMAALCDAAHALIRAVFPKAVDIYQHDKKSKKDLQTPASPLSYALQHITSMKKASGHASKRELNLTRLRNVLVFIQAMLVETYPVAKPIRPQIVLDVIMRALSVSSGTGLILSYVLAVKMQALRSLDALVVCLGPNLIPFSPLVIRFVMQTLKWSSDNPSDEAREIRCAAYGSLGRWLGALRTHQPDARSEDALTDLLLADVTPPRRLVTLTAGAHSTRHLSKKAKRKLANSMLQESNIAVHMPGEKNKISVSEDMNDEVAIAALQCVESFLTVCGMFLKLTTHKRFQERLVRECYNTGEYSPPRALWLLRALDSCRRAAPPAAPPPTQYCLQLYSVLGNSEHSEISKFCSQALLDIRLHLHCSPPSLNFAIDAPPVPDQAEERKKVMTEKNRAALEQLLGEDRLATLVVEDEEVISIGDEPSTKRPRLEDEVSDKISVSSESDKSIEISDDSDEEASFVQEVQIVVENAGGAEIDRQETEIDVLDGNETSEVDKRNDGATDKLTNEYVVIQNEENSNVLTRSVDNNINKEFMEQGSDRIDETNTPTHIKKINIYEASTQLPLNESIDTEEEESPLSMEVAYDYPNTASEKVTALEKIDNDNLPSTNDTDDIQITCGQVIKYSQEVDSVAKSDNPEAKLGDVKVNGINKSPSKVVENGFSGDIGDKGIVTVKLSSEEVSAIDMLANFVDEVNEDEQANTPA